jgi:hypothetical protein
VIGRIDRNYLGGHLQMNYVNDPPPDTERANTPDCTITDRLKLDYEQTTQFIRMLTDIRFKLLAFVPTLTGVGVTILTKSSDPGVVLSVALLGFFVTLGIVFYEMRNTTLYDAAINRARCLESALDLPLFTITRMTKGRSTSDPGGLFTERADRPMAFFGFAIWHDRALALVYGAAFGGWTFLIAHSLLGVVIGLYSVIANLVSIISAVIVASLFIWRFHDFEKQNTVVPVKGRKEKLQKLGQAVRVGD